jgi:hypothetical protein
MGLQNLSPISETFRNGTEKVCMDIPQDNCILNYKNKKPTHKHRMGITQFVKKFHAFMEPKCSLLYSQISSTGLCPEPVECSPHPHTISLISVLVLSLIYT